MSARHEQIGQRAGHEQSMSILLESPVTHLGEAEAELDHRESMLDLTFVRSAGHIEYGRQLTFLGPNHWLTCARCELLSERPLPSCLTVRCREGRVVK